MRKIVLTAALALSNTGAHADWSVFQDQIPSDRPYVSVSAFSESATGDVSLRVMLMVTCDPGMRLAVQVAPVKYSFAAQKVGVLYRIDKQPTSKAVWDAQETFMTVSDPEGLLAHLKAGKKLNMAFDVGGMGPANAKELRPEWNLNGFDQSMKAAEAKCRVLAQ
jgi:hypothetical protein